MEATTTSPAPTRRERREAALRAQSAAPANTPSPVHRTSAHAPRAAVAVAPVRTGEESAPYLTRRQRREMMLAAGAEVPAEQHAVDAPPADLGPNRGPSRLANSWPVAPSTHHGPQVARVTAVEVPTGGRVVPASVPVPTVAAPAVVGPTCPAHGAESTTLDPVAGRPAPELERDDRPRVLTSELEALLAEPSAAGPDDGGAEVRLGGDRPRWVPRVAVLTSLAVATIAVPLTSAATGETDVGGRTTGPSLLDAVSASGTTAALPDTIKSLGDGAQRAQAASRSEDRDTLADCDGSIEPKGKNGQLPSSELCELWQKGYYLAAPAAVAITALNDAFHARFGRNMCLVAAYRTLTEQYTLARTRAGFAAEPGTSNHGLGLAVDFCSSETGNAEVYQWLRANGPTYGWDNPAWARPGGSGAYEPWHFDYVPLVSKIGVM